MTLQELLNALNEKLGLDLVYEGGATALEIDGIPVILQEAEDGIVLVHADLGEIPVDRQDALAAAAMEANYLYQGTGGATLAVDPADGHLHLQKYNWLDRTDADKALEALDRFAETATQWQALLTAPLEDAPASQTDGELPLSNEFMRM